MAVNPYHANALTPTPFWAPTAFWLDLGTLLVPATTAFLVGLTVGSYFDVGLYLGLGLLAISIAGILFMSLMMVEENNFVVMERFGAFHAVKYKGLRIKNPLFDKEHCHDTLSAKGYALYADDPEKAEIDFTDASAPIAAKAWYSIGDPEAVANRQWDRVTPDIALWTYRYTDPRDRALSAFDDALRPRLQSESIQEAQTNSASICSDAVAEAAEALLGIGAYPSTSGKALMILDIAIEKETQEIRQQKLKGQLAREQAEMQYQGLDAAIRGIMKTALEAGHEMSYKEAHDVVFRQRALDAIEKSGANVSFVAQDIDGVVKMLDINRKGP